MTHSSELVAGYLNDNVKCLRVDVTSRGAGRLIREYDVRWTPTLVLADGDGEAQYRWVGYLSPEEYLGQVILGAAHTAYAHRDLETAIERFTRVADELKGTFAAPEALYWLGVAYYKRHDYDRKDDAWGRICGEYSNSTWAERISFGEE